MAWYFARGGTILERMADNGTRYRERTGRHPAVAAVWSYSAEASTSSLIAADGCFDLIVRISKRGVSSFVYTPIAQAHRSSSEPGEVIYGVRLRPGFGAAIANRPALLDEAATLARNCADLLESLVATAVDDCEAQPDIVADFVEQARATSGAMHLATWLSSAQERELQRACKSWLGVTPKAFLRIERAWAAREELRGGSPLVAVSARRGYADQAHLTREMRSLHGLTPRELRTVGNLQDLSSPVR